jgi:transcriptional regulator with XRE-family HTH domain/DNA-binding transcriptional MerR regulator
MPPATATQFGSLLREFRERAGLDQSQLASLLEVSDLLIQKLEGGKRKPPHDLRFYHQLRRVPGFTGADITRLAIIARSNPEWDYKPPLEPQAVRAGVLTQKFSKSRTSSPQRGRVEEAHVPLTTFVHTDTTGLATLLERSPSPILDFPSTFVPIREILDHYPHTSVPEHARQVVAEGKFQEAKAGKTGVVFDSSQAGLLFDALSNPDHKYRQRAVQLVRRFNAAVEKEKVQTIIKERGIMMEQASRKYGVPASTLQDWKELGLIPVLYKGRGKQGVYLDEAAVARAASIYQDAAQKGIQPTRLLKAEIDQQAERRPQLDQGITASSAAREFNVPINFLLRWAKELDVIPILSEGTGQGSATYLDREKAREAAELYHEAKRQKIQPNKLLERLTS